MMARHSQTGRVAAHTCQQTVGNILCQVWSDILSEKRYIFWDDPRLDFIRYWCQSVTSEGAGTTPFFVCL